MELDDQPAQAEVKDTQAEALTLVTAQVNQFINDTQSARELSERDRDYYDHKQWTEDEIARLTKRNQAPIVVNRVKPKVEGLVGLYLMRKTDPKAYPRTKKHENSAHAITDALRYVADDNAFDDIKVESATDFFVEGTGAAIVDVKQDKKGEINIRISHAPWDRIYYDPHSRKKDFSDARFKGLMLWFGQDELKEKFHDVDLNGLMNAGETAGETFEDRPRWVDKERGRIRVAWHFYIKDGNWWMCIFSHNTFLVEPQESPYLDEDGEPTCPIEMVSANVDRNNDRYGEVRGFISQQDEINHRRSKALHLLSQRQTYGRQGSIKDLPALKRELAKPDGHVEFQGEEFGKDFGVLPTGDMAKGQFELYQDAKMELDAVSINAQLAGERQSGDLSGKAIDKLQSAGALELNRQYNLLAGWEKRIYRQIWARIKQFWDEEKWIRVTDDYDTLRWVGLNAQVTAQEWLEEKINDESLDITTRRQASAAYQALVQAQSPMLQEVVDVKNAPAEIDMDIIIDQSFDVINVQQEQFNMLAQFGQNSGLDIIELIELSSIRGKEELIDKINKRRAEAAQAQAGVQEIQMADAQAKTRKTTADASKSEQEAIQKNIENQLLIANPTPVTSVAV